MYFTLLGCNTVTSTSLQSLKSSKPNSKNSTAPSLPTLILLLNPFPLSITLLTHHVKYTGSGPGIFSCECLVSDVIFQSQKVSLMCGFFHMPLHVNLYQIKCTDNSPCGLLVYFNLIKKKMETKKNHSAYNSKYH